MAKRKRLTRMPLIMSLSIALVLTGFFGTFFTVRQMNHTERESAMIEAKFLKDRRELVASKAENLAEYALIREGLADDEMKNIIKTKVEEAHASIMSLYRANKADISKVRLREMALDTLREVRFNGGRGYYFAVSMDGTELLYPMHPEIEGTNLLESGNPEISATIKGEIELIERSGQGFVEAKWEKPEDEGAFSVKTSYIKRVAPFDMYIGAGDFYEDYFASAGDDVIKKAEEVSHGMSVAVVDYGTGAQGGLEVISDVSGECREFISGMGKTDFLGIVKGSEKFNGAFIDQSIRIMDSNTHIPRLVYIRHIPDRDWAFVVYSDLADMESFLADLSVELKGELSRQIGILGLFFVSIMIIAYLIAKYYRDVLSRQIGLFSDFYGNFNKNSKLNLKRFRYVELYKIARVTNLMMESLARVRAELEANEEKFRGFFELSPDLIYIINFRRGIVEEANPAFLEILGYSIDEMQSIPASRLFKSVEGKTLEEAYAEIRSKKEIRNLNLSVISRRGEEIKLEINARFADGTGEDSRVFHIARDVTERFETEKKIRNLAFNDFLTDIPNRNNFMGQLDSLLKEVKGKDYSFGMAFIDLDRFKQINDTLGHHAGDQLLVEVAKRLKGCIRSTDILARLGGDEFVILLGEASSNKSIEIVMQKVMGVFKEPFALSKRSVFVTASIGVSIYPRDGKTAEELIMNSDKAMYYAKDSGRNTCKFYDDSIEGYSYEDLNLETELREAIEREQFVLHYQPVLSCRKMKYVGVEALIRWNHPTRGLIYPDKFIQKAEENGHIVEIGRWVVEQVARDTRMFNELGFVGNSGINISSAQLSDGRLIGILGRAIEDNGLYPGQLVLELTESLAVLETEENKTFMEAFREMGIHVVLDDFGTGYSSISQLHKYPLAVVKIDKSFVSRMGMSEKDMDITSSIIEMAHRFKLKVVAEGVEDEDQHRALVQMGCDMVQGYHFARPMPVEELKKYLGA